MELLRKPDFRYPVILAIVSLALWAPRLRGPIDLRWDAGVYYILGTSMAEGKGYRLSNEPGDIRAVQYPPGLPALVAGEEKFLGTQNTDLIASWLRRTYCAIFLAYVLASYRLARYFFAPALSFLVGMICALSGDMLYLSDLLQAELPFAFVTVLFVLVAKPFARKRDEPPPRESPLRFALASALGIATYLLRSAGIAILAAWVGEALIARRWRAVVARTIITLIPVISWQMYVSHVSHSDEYKHPTYAYQRAAYQYYNVTYAENLLLIDSFKPELGNLSPYTLTKRTVKNSLFLVPRIGEAITSSKAFFGWSVDWINRHTNSLIAQPLLTFKAIEISTIGYGMLMLAGCLLFLVRRQWFMVLYIAATFALICSTPWPKQFLRYLSTIQPFLAICAVGALMAAIKPIARSSSIALRRAGTVVIGAILLGIPVMQASACLFTFREQHSAPAPDATKIFYLRPDWISWNISMQWVGDHAAPGDVIATTAPHLLYLKTGHKSVLPPMEHDPIKAQMLVDSVPVKYVIVAQFDFISVDADYVQPMIDANPRKWRLVFTPADGLSNVYERVTD